jgi:hypothetical protein
MKLELLWFLEELRFRIFGNPFEKFFEKGFEKMRMIENKPSVDAIKRALKQFHETKDEKYNNEAVMILLRFRIVMTDYRFEKLLKELRITKKSAIEAMASVLNFTPSEKGETKWLNEKM